MADVAGDRETYGGGGAADAGGERGAYEGASAADADGEREAYEGGGAADADGDGETYAENGAASADAGRRKDRPAPPVPQEPAAVDVAITVNGEPVILKNKPEYILVDVLDFYPIDTSIAHGDHLETLVNGVDCDFTKPLAAGDEVRIQWVD